MCETGSMNRTRGSVQSRVMFAVALLTVLALGTTAAPVEGQVPDERTAHLRGVEGEGVEGLVTDAEPRPASPLDRPALGETVTDPDFGTRITRISDAGPDGVVKPVYSTLPAWNADESLMYLYATENRPGTHLLLDGQTYEELGELDLRPADIEQLWWHPTDPDVLIYPSGNGLWSYSVEDDASTEIHTFEGCESVSAGGDAHYVSWDGDAVGLLCTDADGADPSMVTYRIGSDSEGERFDLESELWVAPVPLPSGENFLFGTDDGPRVVDEDGNTVVGLDAIGGFEHSTVGTDSECTDTYYSVVFDPIEPDGEGALVATDLTTGDSRVIVGPATGYPYPPSGTHMSAVSHRRPGWIAVSSIGTTDPAEQDALDNEIYLVDSATDEVYRIAHHRSTGRDGRFGYWAEPHVTISPTGTRMAFGSDWGGDRVDTYVIDLRWQTDLQADHLDATNSEVPDISRFYAGEMDRTGLFDSVHWPDWGRNRQLSPNSCHR